MWSKNSQELGDGVLWPIQMKENKWARLLAYVTGLVNQELLLQNEYLTPENRILRAHLPSRVRLSPGQFPEAASESRLPSLLGPAIFATSHRYSEERSPALRHHPVNLSQ